MKVVTGNRERFICFDAKKLGKNDLVSNAELAGTVPLWDWIGDDGANAFSS